MTAKPLVQQESRENRLSKDYTPLYLMFCISDDKNNQPSSISKYVEDLGGFTIIFSYAKTAKNLS